MKKMKEYPLTELGYFSESECASIADALDGKSFMRFHVTWSNCAGNCTLIIKTDYDAPRKEIVNFFLGYAMVKLAELNRR